MESVWIAGKRFCKSISTLDSPRDYSQRIQCDDVRRNREAVPEAERTKTSHTSEDRQNQGTIPMPTFAPRPLTTSSTIPVQLPQNCMVGQQRQQISELQFDKFPHPHFFLIWKIRFKTQVTTCSDFPSDAMLWIKKVEMADSLDEWKSSRSVYGKDFPNFEMLDAILCCEQDHPEFPVQEEGRSRGAESPERGSVSSRKTDRFYDLRLLSSDCRSWHRNRLCWFILCYSLWWQHSGIRDKMGRCSIVDVENSIRWFLEKSAQIEDTWVWSAQNSIRIVQHGDSEDNGSQLSKVENHGEEEERSQTSITKLWRQAWEIWIRSSDEESKGSVQRWRRKRYLLPVERKRPVFARRPMQFPPRDPRSCVKNQNTLPPHLLSQPHHEVEVCRGREVSEANVTMGPFFDNCADIIWKVPARERLVNIGIRPSANSIKMKRVVRLETSVCFRITRLMNNQIKSRKRATSQKDEKATTRMLWLLWKVHHNLGCVSQDSDALVSQAWKSRGNPMQKSTLRHASIREKKGPSLEKINVKVSRQRSPYTMKFEDRSHEETERPQRCARSKAWNLDKNIYKLEEKDKAAFYFPAEEWVFPAASTKKLEEREFVVDSGASMHMVSKKNLNSAELETMRTSRSPTTMMTANGEVQTREEATAYVKRLDLFVKVMLLEETPAVLSLGKLCEHHGFSYHWISGQKPHLIRSNFSNCVPFVVPGLSASSSSTTPSPASPSSSSQDSVFDVNRYNENPVTERSGSTSEGIHRNRKPKKVRNAKKFKEIFRMNCLFGHRSSERICSMKVLQQSLGETQSKEVKTLPSHLMNFQWSREEKWNPVRVSTVCIRTFRRTQIVISAWRRK